MVTWVVVNESKCLRYIDRESKFYRIHSHFFLWSCQLARIAGAGIGGFPTWWRWFGTRIRRIAVSSPRLERNATPPPFTLATHLLYSTYQSNPPPLPRRGFADLISFDLHYLPSRQPVLETVGAGVVFDDDIRCPFIGLLARAVLLESFFRLEGLLVEGEVIYRFPYTSTVGWKGCF